MPLVYKDRVRTTTTDGAASYTSFGAPPSGFVDFSAVANGDTCYICIVHQTTGQWLTGLAAKTAGPTLTLNKVYDASVGGWIGAPGAVAFAAGTKDIFMSMPALKFADIAQMDAIPNPLLTIANMRGGPTGIGASIANSAMAAGRLYMTRFIAHEDMTIDDLSIRVGTASAAGTRCRLGIYNASATTGMPSTLIQDAGTVLTDAIALVSVVASAALEAGKPYWLAALFESTPSVGGFTNSGANAAPLGYDNSTAANMGRGGIYRALAFGALPADETANAGSYVSGAVTIPIVMWKKA